MAINTTNIIGDVLLPSGVVREKSYVIFEMTGFDTDDDDNAVVVPFPIRAPIDEVGAIDVDLWPNPEGVRSTFYAVTFEIYNGAKAHLVAGGKISVPVSGGPYALNDLLPVLPPEGASVEDYIAYLEAAVAATENAADIAVDAAAISQAWAESPTYPVGDLDTMSSKTAAQVAIGAALAAIAATGSANVYLSRAEAISSTTSVTQQTLWLIHGGKLLQYKQGSDVGTGITTNSGATNWEPAGAVYLEHYGVVTSATPLTVATDYTTAVQSALTNTQGDLLFTGWVKITDRVVSSNLCHPKCPEGRAYGGFSIGPDFNMSAVCVLQPGTGETASTVTDLGIYFEQPDDLPEIDVADMVNGTEYLITTRGTDPEDLTNFTLYGATGNVSGVRFIKSGGVALGTGKVSTATKDDLYHYPISINIGHPLGEGALPNPTTVSANTGLPRGVLDRVRITNAWDGLVGYGNMGGYKIGLIETSAFNRGVDLNGALDFVHIDAVHSWAFGYAGDRVLSALAYEDDTIAFRAVDMDGLNVDTLSSWRGKVVLGGDVTASPVAVLPMMISKINLDGDNSTLELGYCSTMVSDCYSTKSVPDPALIDVSATSGIHQIGRLKATSTASEIVATSGTAQLTIGDYTSKQSNGGRKAAVAKGASCLTIGMARPDSAGLTRTVAMYEQQSGASMRINALLPVDTTQPAVSYVTYNSDDLRNYINSPNYSISANVNWTRGVYIGRNLSLRNSTISNNRRVGTGEGPEISLQLARGSVGSETVPEIGANIGDYSWAAWDGSTFHPAAYLRVLVNGTVSAGVAPSKLQAIVTNSVGGATIPLTITPTGLSVIAPTYATNAAAISGGLAINDVYKTADGTLRIVV